MKQAKLPEGAEYERPRLATMAYGDVAYTTGWAMWVDRDRACWLHPGYSAENEPGGTVSMRVELHADGYHVWPAEGYGYELQDRPGYIGSGEESWLPVTELHYDEGNLPSHVFSHHRRALRR